MTPFNIQLMITEQCNLRCAYCFEIDKNAREMPVDLTKKLLDHELSQKRETTEYQVDLAGGEPFLHFDMVKEIVDYGERNAERWGKKFHFFICSNLTLLNDEIKSWLEERCGHVILGTSLDGTREAHNHYRCNSYDDVICHIPFYRKLYPNQGAKMTIGPDTIGSIYEGILNIESFGLTLSANVVYEPVWGDPENKRKLLRKFAEQLDLLVDHYANNPNLEVPTLLSLPIRLLLAPKNKDHKWCGSGTMMVAYDTDGRKLPCHRFSRFCTEKIYKGNESIGPRIITKCDECVFNVACPTCPGYNWQVHGHPDSRTHNHCEFIKLQLLAIAKLIFLRNESLINQLSEGSCANIGSIPRETLGDILATRYVMESLDEDLIISSV